MLVQRCVIVEIKATELLSPVAKNQLRNYLAATKLDLGMLLHFGPKAHHYRVLGPQKLEPHKE
jgi:GxxExxY protein